MLKSTPADRPKLGRIPLVQHVDGTWHLPRLAGGDSALDEKVKEISKAIEVKTAEAKKAWADFEAHRKTLADAGPDEIDITNPEDPLVKAADEAMKPYSKASDELANLHATREKFWAMTGEKGKHLTEEQKEQQAQAKDLLASEWTLGAKTVGSTLYKQLKDDGLFADGDGRPLKGRVGDPMEMKHFKSLLTSGTGAAGGVLLTPDRLPGLYDIPQLPLSVLQLLTVGETSQKAVEFVRMLARTIAAAEVAEAVTTADIGGGVTPAQGGQKPESGLTFEVASEAVRTIAHWMPGTRNMLADAPFLQTLIDSELTEGVKRRAETQSVVGLGTGDEIRGIMNTPGILSYEQGTTLAGESKVDALHRMLTMLRLQGFNPTAQGLNPLDWEDIRLSKDANENYIWGPPSQAGPMVCWGVPVVSSIAFAEGNPITAEWARGLFLIREAVKVLVSDSHKDWFTRNMLAILAEMRGVLVIPRPQAFGETVFED
jgi:HK97 family phage major capsid protein